jgi:hypothetical protein
VLERGRVLYPQALVYRHHREAESTTKTSARVHELLRLMLSPPTWSLQRKAECLATHINNTTQVVINHYRLGPFALMSEVLSALAVTHHSIRK